MDGDHPPLLRNSERSDFGRCWWLWWEHWENGISPLRAPTWSIFGTAWHEALEFVYNHTNRTERVYRAAEEIFLAGLDDMARKVGVTDYDDYEEEEADGKKVKLLPAKDLGPIMLRNYWKEYGPENNWEVLHTEQPFQINVPHPSGPRSNVLVVQAGTWDMLIRDRRTGRYWLVDHKSCKSLPQPDFLEMDDQAGTYLWVAKKVLVHKGILKRTDKISGIIFSYAKKHPGDDRPRNEHGEALNQNGSVSKRPRMETFLRYPATRTPLQQVNLARRVQDTAMVMQLVRTGELPVLKNITKDCPRCVLFDLCNADEAGEDFGFIKETMYTTRDMYADHREDMQRSGIEL